MPLTVSVVIPARDDAVMLRRCLAALARQTRPADEIVVVDNGSTDDTRAVAQAAGARVVVEPIAGIPRAASAGYDAATGDLIARIDADTVSPPGWIAHAVAAFESDPSVDAISGDASFYGGSDRLDRRARRIWIGGMYWSMTAWLGHPPLFGSNFVMRRTMWREISGEVHRETRRIHDDLDLSVHVKPWMTVRRDRELFAAISARPFATLRGTARRVWWVVPTLAIHLPDEVPWRRRAARRAWARAMARPDAAEPAYRPIDGYDDEADGVAPAAS